VVDFKTPDELGNIIDFDLKEVGLGNNGSNIISDSIDRHFLPDHDDLSRFV